MSSAIQEQLSVAEFASLFGFPEDAVRHAVETQRQRRSNSQAFYTIPQLKDRWQCSRAQVYQVLYAAGVKALNVGQGKKRAKYLVPTETVLRIEKALTEKMG